MLPGLSFLVVGRAFRLLWGSRLVDAPTFRRMNRASVGSSSTLFFGIGMASRTRSIGVVTLLDVIVSAAVCRRFIAMTSMAVAISRPPT